MLKILWILACLVFASHGKDADDFVGGASPLAKDMQGKQSESNEQIRMFSSLKAIATLLAASQPGVGWQVPGVSPSRGLDLHSPLANPARSLSRLLHGSLLTLLTTTALFVGSVGCVHAENELAQLAASKSASEIVEPQCIVRQCKQEMEMCADNGDCLKGLLCTAKCLGDTQCTLGCFAQYGSDDLNNVLQCTIEKEKCINIGIVQPGSDGPFDAPLPPKPLIRMTQADMSGKWYKVMGWNPFYDCFDCQRNSFSKQTGVTGTAIDSRFSSSSVGMQVDFSMPRTRAGRPSETFQTSLMETLKFDRTPGTRRTAYTEGKMFGVSFWENWYVIGKEKDSEPPFRFVYYTGKTIQNRYKGAFVYARQPELPREALPSIYKIAREAGIEPTGMCCINNNCFTEVQEAVATAFERNAGRLGFGKDLPPFTPVAEASTDSSTLESAKSEPDAKQLGPWTKFAVDVKEYFEDPRPAGKALFENQRKMSELREYNSDGYRVPSWQ